MHAHSHSHAYTHTHTHADTHTHIHIDLFYNVFCLLNILALYYIFFLTAYMTFLAYSKVNGIEAVHIGSNDSDPNPPRNPIENSTYMKNVIGLTMDYANQRYFFSDIQMGSIQSVHFNGTGFKTIVGSK